MELDYSKQINRKIKICEKSKVNWVEIEDISHLVCDGYITTIHLTNNETISTSRLLKQFEEVLTGFGFLKANRSTLVNLRHIKSIYFSKSTRVIHINNSEIKVSRRRTYLFKKGV